MKVKILHKMLYQLKLKVSSFRSKFAVLLMLAVAGISISQSQAQTLTPSSGSGSFTVGNGTAVVVDPGVTVTGVSTINNATVYISSGLVSSDDQLIYPATLSGVTGSYTASTGVLLLSGSATAAQYQTILRSIQYKNTNASASASTKTITMCLGDAIPFTPCNATVPHFYKLIISSDDWNTAKTDASNTTYFGLQGYLATITCQQENDLITQKLNASAYIGASDQATLGDWIWATGPETGTQFYQGTDNTGSAVGGMFVNWASGEPNNSLGAERVACIYGTQRPAWGELGFWNDVNATPQLQDQIQGYVLEFGGMAGDPSIQINGDKNINLVAASAIPCGSTISINAPTFAGLANLFQLNGNANVDASNNLQMTTSGQQEAGSAFWKSKLAFSNNFSFSSFFTLAISQLSATGADGMAFVIQNGTATSLTTGPGLGYGAISPSVIVEFDTWKNTPDPDANHIAIVIDGDYNHVNLLASDWADPPFNMKTIGSFNVWVDFNGATKTLEVRVSTTTTRPATPLVSKSVDFAAKFGTSPLYTGFSGSTGSEYSNQEVTKFLFDNVYSPTGIDPTCTYQSAPSNIAVTPNPATIFVGTTSVVTAHVTNPDGSSAPGVYVNLSSGTLLTLSTSGGTSDANGNVTTVATGVNVGTETVNASIASGATGNCQINVIQPQIQTITFSDIVKTYGNAAFALTATASSGLAVTYSSGDNTIITISGSTATIHKVGVTTITATQAGNNVWAAVSKTVNMTVNKAPLNVTADNKTITYGATVPALTYQITGYVYGETVSVLTGTPSLSTTATGTPHVGTYPITLVVGTLSSGNYSFNFVAGTLTVNKAPQTITFGSLPIKYVDDVDFAITATATSGFPVSFSSSDATIATIVNGQIHIVGIPGSLTITASQAGNSDYLAATNVNQPFLVIKHPQTINTIPIPPKYVGDNDVDPLATATSGLPVSYSCNCPGVASIVNNKVHILGQGSCLIYVDQAGNNIYNAAPTETVDLIVNPVTIYNFVSPNGDGKNDTWGLEHADVFANAVISIFNSYGQKVFSGNGYDTWDGTYNGKSLLTGEYYYIVKTSSTTYKGIILLRK